MHQAEAILRSQAEAALRLAVSQAAAVVAGNNVQGIDVQARLHNNNNSNNNNQGGYPGQQNGLLQQAQPNQQGQAQQQHPQQPPQQTQDLSEALRLQEQRLEQALRLHGGDPRALGFPMNHQHQIHNP
jgi:hypothetical protein